ncbi:uncharacterized protein LOC131957918 isoform X1 [Physella acuta]|uniref:uncharacterized protein LOC131957918 isoform X1 n=1 Tax=Physella acuta TaxID=109671 RepID=UPI0027DBCF58|nr:uncharacterized protein LOC131957918 isoform X1 [Physella acuta]XP_059178747.1 uncharacterized protein LOC131957918 isoform X2 [Physella acuta]XP_059178748.1 uncharacterized protein LOC131957918 isoform X3 [Physella acuta]XP_059178749.1 uncharacterized protein LOC131957918 isoform X1 [Physella acuta]XP_059178751.1 uncharacterized protein LOC131957918 isoform X1 [Physella acuta]
MEEEIDISSNGKEQSDGVSTPTTTPTPHITKSGADVEGRQSNLDKFVTLIQKDPQMRTDFECHEFVPFLRKHIEWFHSLKQGSIQEIIKRCKYLRVEPDSIFIKQGDTGDSMFAILRGEVSVHVIFESENERECLNRVEAALGKKKFSKNDFGNEVAQKTAGACIGEVALVSENCMRTASCFASTLCEFVVIDRALYAVSVKEVIEKEFQDKTNFVERNPFFKSWTPRQRNQLVISFKKIKIGYSEKLARQGQEVDNVYFIYKGDVEIQIDSSYYERQYPQLYTEMKKLLPELIRDPKSIPQAPHLLRKERMAGHKPQKICILGENEIIGSLEIILGLETYIENATAPGDCELLVLKKSQFEKMFKRKYALATLDKLKEVLANKLCLYIYQSDPNKVAFLKFLNIKLMDSSILQEVKRSKNAKVRQGTNIGAERQTRNVEEQEIINVMKRLHMNSDSAAELPPEDMSEIALAKMDRRLRLWSEYTNMNGSKLAGLQSSTITLSNNSRVA